MPRTATHTASGEPRCRARVGNLEGRCRKAGVEKRCLCGQHSKMVPPVGSTIIGTWVIGPEPPEHVMVWVAGTDNGTVCQNCGIGPLNGPHRPCVRWLNGKALP